MRQILTLPVLILPVLALALGSSACLSTNPTQELSQEAVCLHHNENDPVERDRCRQSPETRRDTVPDVRPQDLPIRTGGLSD